MLGAGSLVFLDNYLKGAVYCASGAYIFTQSTPSDALVALFLSDNSNDIINHYYGIAGANVDTQPATVALVYIYFRHFRQNRYPPYVINSLSSNQTICL